MKTKSAKTQTLRATQRRLRAVTTGPSLELFQKEECPYSQSVRQKLSDLGVDWVARTVPADNDLKHKQLVDAGGKDQIPFLVDHRSGVKLHESAAIQEYLEKEYGGSPGQAGGDADTLAREMSRLKIEAARAWNDLHGIATTSLNIVKSFRKRLPSLRLRGGSSESEAA